MDNLKKRIEWIDYLKAFACFLVVLGHLLQSLQKINIDSNLNISSFLIWFIYLFHMPLFMCMSGFLYCKNKKDFSWNEYKKFEIKKIINLTIPYIFFYLLSLFINILFSSSVNTPKGINELIGIFNNPMAPYWFLYTLLSIFIVIPLIEKILKKDYLVFTILSIFKILSLFIKTNIFFIDSIMEYGIYFYIGAFIKEKNTKNNKLLISILAITYICFSLLFYILSNNLSKHIVDIFKLLFAISGILICISIFRYIKNSKVLDTFKKYTFQIYLTHTIFAAGVRILLLKLGVRNYYIHFCIGLLVSIYIPVFISIISDKILYTNIFFYPIRTIEKIKERKMINNE